MMLCVGILLGGGGSAAAPRGVGRRAVGPQIGQEPDDPADSSLRRGGAGFGGRLRVMRAFSSGSLGL